MSADRTTQWAEKYSSLLQGYTDLLGGDNISATKRATAETLATLGVELSQLTDRFASGGRGASPEDLNLYLRLSGNVAAMLEGAGLQQNNTDQSTGGSDAALIKLTTAFNNIKRANAADEAAGIFHDAHGVIITDPAAIVLEKWIYTLKGMRDNPPPLVAAATPALETLASPAPATPASPANVIDLQRGVRRAPEPATPAPIVAEPTSTQRFLEWSANGGGGDSWSAGPNWPRLR